MAVHYMSREYEKNWGMAREKVTNLRPLREILCTLLYLSFVAEVRSSRLFQFCLRQSFLFSTAG